MMIVFVYPCDVIYHIPMKITNGIKYRLHPDENQAEILSKWIGCQRFIYNAKVEEDRALQKVSFAGRHPAAGGSEVFPVHL